MTMTTDRPGMSRMTKRRLWSMTCAEAVKHAARIIYAAHDEKDKEFECELSWICDASGGEFKRVPEAIRAEAVELAKAALEDDDMDV